MYLKCQSYVLNAHFLIEKKKKTMFNKFKVVIITPSHPTILMLCKKKKIIKKY